MGFIGQTHVQEFESGEEIGDVAAQGFEAWVRAHSPLLWHPAHQKTASDGLQLCIHHHQTLNGFQQVLNAHADCCTQPSRGETDEHKTLDKILHVDAGYHTILG